MSKKLILLIAIAIVISILGDYIFKTEMWSKEWILLKVYALCWIIVGIFLSKLVKLK